MQIVWITDLHMDHLDKARTLRVIDEIKAQKPDALFISGDIANARLIRESLETVAEKLPVPIYFVLGNHDFYHGSIAEVNATVDAVCAARKNLKRLGRGEVLALSPTTGLIGHDGWGDGRAGAGSRSTVLLNDFTLIGDLAGLNETDLFLKLESLGRAAGEYFQKTLEKALRDYRHVYIVTHVPPFVEACWHRGAISSPEWQSHFTCVAAGEAIREVSAKFPGRRVTVLCGHTHSAGDTVIDGRITVKTGGTEYGDPHVNGVFEF